MDSVPRGIEEMQGTTCRSPSSPKAAPRGKPRDISKRGWELPRGKVLLRGSSELLPPI